MKIEYRVVKGSQATRPAEIDTTSSPSTVYLRKEIKRITEVDEQGEETYLWQYEEAELTPEEYKLYLAETENMTTQLLMQQINDLAATQEMTDVTAEIYHEEQMQLLNDIQADIILGGEV